LISPSLILQSRSSIVCKNQALGDRQEMIGGRGRGETLASMKKKLEGEIIQEFPYRCPYCDEPISYDQFDLGTGENKVQCPSCKKIYIKVVSNSYGEGASK
jgi:hypothetical protein